ncbi:hypothetical protein N7517_000858 [Penicillium concentricum]|uniref:Trichodiene synthase n=1 Tax=Penicillium concentricum TaxID=293559 RepID=A0A9W9VIA9_9EURO|nr:uncharacterized protein N7517_000858 [Penicillium concentricum]KAJ5382947.1 hypothetical protein N7517_000858 [Penicillium concentricum]
MAIAVSPELKTELSGIIKAFLLDIDYEFPPQLYNGEFPLRKLYLAVEHEVKLHFKNKGFSDDFIAKVEKQLRPSIDIAITAYHTTPFDVQCTVAIFSAYSFIADDWAHDLEFRNDLKRFNICLLTRQPQGNPVLQCWGEFLSSFHSIFGQFASDMIIKDTMQFISACYAEAEGEKLHFPTEAQRFPEYFRQKVGISEAFSFLFFPLAQFSEAECRRNCLPMMPYLTSVLAWVNDILSYYKEMVEMESFNFIANSARCQGVTEMECLRKLCDESSDMIRTLHTLAKADTKLSKALEASLSGYITFHLMQARYRLEDLDLASISDAT